MATNIDSALMPFDPAMMGMEPAIEIEIENPDSVTIGGDGLEITLEPGEDDDSDDHGANLAESMDEAALQALGSELLELIDADITSRKEWVETYIKGLEVLGMKYEERTEPWSGACGVYSSLLSEAAIRFQSEMITETFPARGPVKTKIVGAIDRLKEEAAERVREDMNYRLTEEMISYRPEHERLLFSLGLTGAAFKKIYARPDQDNPDAVFVPAEDLVMPFGASNVYEAERVTHCMRKTKNDLRKLQVAGFYRDVDLGEPQQVLTDIEKKKAEEEGYALVEAEWISAAADVEWDDAEAAAEAADLVARMATIPDEVVYGPLYPQVDDEDEEEEVDEAA